jgi:hypothetical protein
MAISAKDAITNYPAIALRGWRNGESRTIKFLDNGHIVEHEEYGTSAVYDVIWQRQRWTLWAKKEGPLWFGLARALLKIVNDGEEDSLEGRILNIKKFTGSEYRDTRYEAVMVE